MKLPQNVIAHPELIAGPNPLLEFSAAAYIPFDECPKHLAEYPLDAVDWQELPETRRAALLNLLPMHFVCSSDLFAPAEGLQLLLRRSLVLCNPLAQAEKIRRNSVALSTDLRKMMAHSLALLHETDAAGAIWKGITATGKTSLCLRVLRKIGPNQCVTYGPSEACGWTKLLHLVWLYVDFPTNGTRGALLKRVLLGVDAVLGTDYLEQHQKTANIDTLLVVVCRILSMHRLSLLVIDEKQQKTFEDNALKVEFVLFYLGLMNLGISVVLLGNPLAFVSLELFSQVVRRFSVGGVHDFLPAHSPNEPWWKDDYVMRMHWFCLANAHCMDTDLWRKREHELSGGLKGLQKALMHESQTVMFRRGAPLELRIEDMETAAKSPGYRKLVKIAETARGVQAANGEFDDIPMVLPKQPKKASKVQDVVSKLLASYNSEQTRAKTRLLNQMEALAELPQDDVRMLGVDPELVVEARRMKVLLGSAAPAKKAQVKGRGKK